jgi:hypothetical protein
VSKVRCMSAELQVRADVTEGADKLVEAVRGVDAVICATGFRRSFDPFAPWKVCRRTNPIGVSVYCLSCLSMSVFSSASTVSDT